MKEILTSIGFYLVKERLNKREIYGGGEVSIRPSAATEVWSWTGARGAGEHKRSHERKRAVALAGDQTAFEGERRRGRSC